MLVEFIQGVFPLIMSWMNHVINWLADLADAKFQIMCQLHKIIKLIINNVYFPKRIISHFNMKPPLFSILSGLQKC